MSVKKAIRKKRITEEVYFEGKLYPYYNNLHQYSKNKIHCSCPLCSDKTNNKGKHSIYPNSNYKISDQRKIDSMNSQFDNWKKL